MRINGQSNSQVNGRRRDVLSAIASGRQGRLLENGKIKLDFADLVEIGDLFEQWLNYKLQSGGQSPCHFNEKETGFLAKLQRVLDDNHANPQFGLQDMAFEMYMSTRQLQRKLKELTGYNPAEFLRCFRLKRARELLGNGTQVGLVADAVGFSSPAYFASCFKAQFGLTPTQYQQQLH